MTYAADLGHDPVERFPSQHALPRDKGDSVEQRAERLVERELDERIAHAQRRPVPRTDRGCTYCRLFTLLGRRRRRAARRVCWKAILEELLPKEVRWRVE